MRQDLKMTDSNGKRVVIAPREYVFRYLRHHVPDGDYAVEGPGVDATFYRIKGMIYVSSGVIDDVVFPPRSREECLAAEEFQS